MALSLESISRNRTKPPILTVLGGPGIGKTTFAAGMPAPIFIQTEDGLGALDVEAFPLASNYESVLDALGLLYSEDHGYETLVLDSLDWLEPLIWERVCRDHSIPNIEALGYGKGYVEALSYWRLLLQGIKALRDDRNMLVCLIAHSQIVRISDPVHPEYDSHDLKMHRKASALVDEFSDIIAFASLKTVAKSEDAGFGQKRTRAITSGERIMHTVGAPAYTAKNRYSLPDPLPLSWAALADALAASVASQPDPKTETEKDAK